MDDKSLLNKVEFYKKITKKHNLTSNHCQRCDKELPFKNLNKDEVLRLWSRFLKNNTDFLLSLYVHIPFCKDSRCRYCILESNILANSSQIDSYLGYLEDEIKFFSPVFSNNEFATLYIGGGTPSILNIQQLKRLFDMVFNNFKFKSEIDDSKYKSKINDFKLKSKISDICSINKVGNKIIQLIDIPGVWDTRCIEISPFTLTQEKILLAKEKGFNRISIGIQSLDKDVLKTSNRKFVPFDTLKDIIEFIKIQDFKDFNVDLIALLPDDSISKFIRGIEKIMQLDVPSITIYFYKYYPFKFQNLSSVKGYEKFVNYKSPYSRYKLLESIKPLLKKYSYFSLFDNPNYGGQHFLKVGHKRPTVYPTVPYWSLKNSVLGLGLHARSSLGTPMRYHNTNTDINNLDF